MQTRWLQLDRLTYEQLSLPAIAEAGGGFVASIAAAVLIARGRVRRDSLLALCIAALATSNAVWASESGGAAWRIPAAFASGVGDGGIYVCESLRFMHLFGTAYFGITSCFRVSIQNSTTTWIGLFWKCAAQSTNQNAIVALIMNAIWFDF